uniref:Late expression factor 11 n=1 Tax=Chrysodeixis includens nucleopolyhedrovirus TaxID=1207438 RepID=A0A1C8ZZ04_9ABAC|nr:LEF11 [Chrysodeixis includens nucleopolyhedrovirus]AOL57174.1 LEF11 [Chrysodeixis includens nucleopolyhedrovirus]QGW49162.1 LEF11 [Chrysodeixis includens nucleopolyhedrovirus]QGW49442.1 LEF11 [Chrysodeixis includens nucleopolyhedrovirus]QGW49582.1 LEF11 [Chrysodeixis includens nucleopolyhedrovirus]
MEIVNGDKFAFEDHNESDITHTSLRQHGDHQHHVKQQRQNRYSNDEPSRPEKYSQCCLTRSEIYALLREIINKRKHTGDVTNVCDHVFDDGFATQFDYIRNNLDKALITVGGQRTQCKRVKCHHLKLKRIFHLNKSLETEYQESSNRYGQLHQKL